MNYQELKREAKKYKQTFFKKEPKTENIEEKALALKRQIAELRETNKALRNYYIEEKKDLELLRTLIQKYIDKNY